MAYQHLKAINYNTAHDIALEENGSGFSKVNNSVSNVNHPYTNTCTKNYGYVVLSTLDFLISHRDYLLYYLLAL